MLIAAHTQHNGLAALGSAPAGRDARSLAGARAAGAAAKPGKCPVKRRCPKLVAMINLEDERLAAVTADNRFLLADGLGLEGLRLPVHDGALS